MPDKIISDGRLDARITYLVTAAQRLRTPAVLAQCCEYKMQLSWLFLRYSDRADFCGVQVRLDRDTRVRFAHAREDLQHETSRPMILVYFGGLALTEETAADGFVSCRVVNGLQRHVQNCTDALHFLRNPDMYECSHDGGATALPRTMHVGEMLAIRNRCVRRPLLYLHCVSSEQSARQQPTTADALDRCVRWLRDLLPTLKHFGAEAKVCACHRDASPAAVAAALARLAAPEKEAAAAPARPIALWDVRRRRYIAGVVRPWDAQPWWSPEQPS